MGLPNQQTITRPRQSQKVPVVLAKKPHLPGIIILVHGVNSTGEWYESAERNLCEGLNIRLNLPEAHQLKLNTYNSDQIKTDSRIIGERVITQFNRSPIIRFYWGYRSTDEQLDEYEVPLMNMQGKNFWHALKVKKESLDELRKQGPWFWGGGPFQNGSENLKALWGEEGFNKWVMGVFSSQLLVDQDRRVNTSPPRAYMAHHAQRLANLIDKIKEQNPFDTVTLISHSQGTMIAMAATLLAQKSPNCVMVMNSPYAMDEKLINNITYDSDEMPNDRQRYRHLSNVISKINPFPLNKSKSLELDVGLAPDGKTAWSPSIEGEAGIKERDNHGRFYIYFNPHDRVMGSSILESIGWQGLPNDKTGAPHPLFSEMQGRLYQRMTARSSWCGSEPNAQTPFGTLPDMPANSFWDEGASNFGYNDPPKDKTVNINAEQVPSPFKFGRMRTIEDFKDGLPIDGDFFDEIVGVKNKNRLVLDSDNKTPVGTGAGIGIGQEDLENKPNDDTFEYYLPLYPKVYKYFSRGSDTILGYSFHRKNSSRGGEPMYDNELATDEERRNYLGSYVSQPSDHSSTPGHALFIRNVVAYDIPIGFCDSFEDREFWTELIEYADWTSGQDPYFIENDYLGFNSKNFKNLPPMPYQLL